MTNQNKINPPTDYDYSIHTNPDAVAWAKFYTETRDKWCAENPDGQFDTEENMVGWFSNAMMAMHDHIKGISMTIFDDGSAIIVDEM